MMQSPKQEEQHNMTNDRNYLRMMHDSELTRYAQDNVRTELEFILLERLEHLIDADEQLDDAKKEIVELNARLDRWMEQANTLQAQLDAK
jgi:glycerol-3-phosphate dehydrogenase